MKVKITENFRQIVISHLTDNDINADELARSAGVSGFLIWKIIHSKKPNFKPSTIKKISDCLGLNFTDYIEKINY